jgi:hypothetical protein
MARHTRHRIAHGFVQPIVAQPARRFANVGVNFRQQAFASVGI